MSKNFLKDMFINEAKPALKRHSGGSGGGGGSATVTFPGGWQGTVVPNNEYIENIYFNTELSIDEVNALFDNITFSSESEAIAGNASGGLLVLNISTITGGSGVGYAIIFSGSTFIPIFNSSTEDVANQVLGTAFTGWHSDFNGVFEFNDTAITEMGGMTIGSQNNLLSSLFSTTPIVQVEAGIVELIGEYDGSPVVINNIEPGWQGTPVPNSGYVENVYFNTELSIEEVSNIVKKTLDFQDYWQKEYLLWNEDNIVTQMYIEYRLENGIPDFTIQIYTPDGFGGACYSGEECYDYELGGNFIGWNPRLSNPFPINLEVISKTYYGDKVGTKNKLLSSLFSLTPFEFKNKEEASTINLKEYIKEQKLPLQFKIDLPKQPNTLVELLNKTRSCSHLFEYYDQSNIPNLLNYDDTKNVEYFNYMYKDCYNVTSFPELNTSNGYDFTSMYEGCYTANSFPELDTQYGYYFTSMYEGCSHATSFPELDASNGYEFTNMYKGCSDATSFPELNASNGYYFKNMYEGCSNATSFPELDTSNGHYFNNMYKDCYNATSFPELNTSNGYEFTSMYKGCSNATSFPELNTSNGYAFTSMYEGCSNAASFPELDTSNCDEFTNMYRGCNNATSFPELNTQDGTDFTSMYEGCSNATYFPRLDTSNGRNFNSMYTRCKKAKVIDISHYNVSDSSDSYQWCYDCYSLKAVVIRSFGENYILNNSAFGFCLHMFGDTYKDLNEIEHNPTRAKDGYVYVPRDMIETLQTAENWSQLQFRALEDYTVDGTTTGDLSITKAMPEECIEILTDKLVVAYPSETQTFSISLKEFTNIPSVNITSDNENIVVSNINVTQSAITFDVTRLTEECSANIGVSISGDANMTYSFALSYASYVQPTYEVKKVESRYKGFEINSDEYYESTNKDMNTDSFAICRIDINNLNPNDLSKMTLECILDPGHPYDYFVVSKFDKELNTSTYGDNSTAVLQEFSDLNAQETKEVSCTLPNGNHTVYVKYRRYKNKYSTSERGSFKFKVRIEKA